VTASAFFESGSAIGLPRIARSREQLARRVAVLLQELDLGVLDLLQVAVRSFSVRLTLRENFSAAITMPSTPVGTSSEAFFTSSPARPKIACSSFSSGVSSLLLFGRDLADQDVARLDARADLHDAGLVEVAQRALADVRDVARELLAAELGLADLDLELVDVDRRVDVVLDRGARTAGSRPRSCSRPTA
jgi:hypothetical protein